MKYIVLIALSIATMATMATSAAAQSDEEQIVSALTAAPARGRDAAGVIAFNADHTWRTLKEGTSQLVCYDRSSDEGRPAFAVQCTVLGNLDRVAQSRTALAENADGEAVLRELEASGDRIFPVFGSVFISMNGEDQASARTHKTISVPNATTASIGLPENPGEGGAWVMGAGSTGAHIMIPGS
jgi:hypothetical protein